MSRASAVLNEIWVVDHDQPAFDVKTMKDILAESFSQPRVFGLILAVFSTLALLLAAAGIYGVMSYSVEQRTHEIGIRMALGAEPQDILKLVVSQGLVLALVGVTCGVTAAFGLTRLLSSLLYGVSATDPLTLAAVAILLLFVAIAACYVPALVRYEDGLTGVFESTWVLPESHPSPIEFEFRVIGTAGTITVDTTQQMIRVESETLSYPQVLAWAEGVGAQ